MFVKTKLSLPLLAFLLLALGTACEPDEPMVDNEEELITTMTLTLVPDNGGPSVALGFQDLDGDGGMAPTITGGTLMASTTYTGQLALENQSVTPTENITTEVVEEAREHQVFYEVDGGLALVVTYLDNDGANRPLGIVTQFAAGPATTGNLTVTLRHQPDKDAPGVSSGNLANAGGETDIEVTFPVVIQ